MEEIVRNCRREFVENRLRYSLHVIQEALRFFGRIAVVLGGTAEDLVLNDIMKTFFKKYRDKMLLILLVGNETSGYYSREIDNIYAKVFKCEKLENEIIEIIARENINCIITGSPDPGEEQIIYNSNDDSSRLCPLLNWSTEDISEYSHSQKIRGIVSMH